MTRVGGASEQTQLMETRTAAYETRPFESHQHSENLSTSGSAARALASRPPD